MGRPDHQQSPGLMRLAGMGVELVGALVVFVLLGWWIDRSFNTEPWGLVICACLGIIGGLYNLVRTAVHEALGVSKSRREWASSDDNPPNWPPPGDLTNETGEKRKES